MTAPEFEPSNLPAPVAEGMASASIDSSPYSGVPPHPVAAPDERSPISVEELLADRPGPGLPEALGWTALVLAGQVAAMMLLMVVVFAVMLVSNQGRLPPNAFDLKKLGPDAFALVSGLPALLSYCVLIPLACWRISPQPLRKLNFSHPSWTQSLIVCSCVLPLGYISDGLYTLSKQAWEQFLDQFPVFDSLRAVGLDSTMSQLNGASLPLLLLLLAVVPAVGEEWMLRGLIGRGLVARWGVFAGVSFTSMLFAVMHLDPPHVAAVLPIGVMMHVVYLATRSFWMPIAYHFLNNATVSLFTSLGAGTVGEPAGDWWWAPQVVAIPYLALAVAALWYVRTKYLTAEGREPDRGYFSFEHYPESVARRVAPNHVVLGAIFGVLLAAQLGKLGADAWTLKYGQPADDAGVVAERSLPDEAGTATAN